MPWKRWFKMHRRHHPGEIYGHNRLGRVRGEVRRCLADTCDYVTRAHIRGPGSQGEWQALLKPRIFGNHFKSLIRKSNAKRRLTTITIEPLVVCICMCDTMTSAPGQCGYCLPAQGTQGRLSQQRSPHFLSASLAAHPHPPTVRDFFTWKFLIILSLAS